LPVIDSTTERKVFFWNLFESSVAGILRHTWYKDDAKVAEVDLTVGVSTRWRTWSSKKIVPKAHAGKWKVVVVSTVGEASEVICVAHFIVK
jgi:anti-sigma factor RsiW